MTKLSTAPYKGTRDFYPDDMRVRDYIFAVWRRVMQNYGYEPYDTPVLEPLEIYAAKSGQELVNDQTYTFSDRGERVVAIRPEMTPSVSRLVASRRQELSYPARLYNIAQFMRYERPQRGREREFWQLNADIFGDESGNADREVISLGIEILQKFGATSDMYQIRVNHRQLVDIMMRDYLGLDDAAAYQMTKLFDRKNKLKDSEFDYQLAVIVGEDRRSDVTDKVQRLLAVHNVADLPAEIKDSSAVQDIDLLIESIQSSYDVDIRFDIMLMRGLDYYTGVVFEVFDTDPGNNRSLFGGGRYDGLVALFGVEPISAVGFAPGYSTTEIFLKSHNLLPQLDSKTDLYIATLPGGEEYADRIAHDLRQKGLNIEIDYSSRKVDRKIKSADKKSIKFILVCGPDEAASGDVTLKNLATHQETTVNPSAISDILRTP